MTMRNWWQSLGKPGRRGLIVALVVGTFAVIGLANRGSNDSGTTASSSSPAVTIEDPNPPAEQTGGSIDSGWFDEAQVWSSTLADAMATIGDIAGNESAGLLAGDTDVTVRAATALATIERCTADIPAGAPASLSGVVAKMENACSHYENGAHLFARGIDSGNYGLVSEAATEFQAGTPIIAEATAEMKSVAGIN
jgi:hypothetical protein